MKEEHIKKLIPALVEGQLKDETRQSIELHLIDCEHCRLEYEQYQVLNNLLIKHSEANPSEEMRKRFYERLHQETSERSYIPKEPFKKFFSLKNGFKVAASIVIILASFLMGKFSEQNLLEEDFANSKELEVEGKELAIISLIKDPSASRRIMGIYRAEEMPIPDNEVLKVITQMMILDENVNVRLAAVRALEDFLEIGFVKDAYLTSLRKEKDATIQIETINILARNVIKDAVLPLRELLNQESVEPLVKEQIEINLPTII